LHPIYALQTVAASVAMDLRYGEITRIAARDTYLQRMRLRDLQRRVISVPASHGRRDFFLDMVEGFS